MTNLLLYLLAGMATNTLPDRAYTQGREYTNWVELVSVEFSYVTNRTAGDNAVLGSTIVATQYWYGVEADEVHGMNFWGAQPATERWEREVVVLRKTARISLDGREQTITEDRQLSDVTRRWRLREQWEPEGVETNKPVNWEDVTLTCTDLVDIVATTICNTNPIALDLEAILRELRELRRAVEGKEAK